LTLPRRGVESAPGGLRCCSWSSSVFKDRDPPRSTPDSASRAGRYPTGCATSIAGWRPTRPLLPAHGCDDAVVLPALGVAMRDLVSFEIVPVSPSKASGSYRVNHGTHGKYKESIQKCSAFRSYSPPGFSWFSRFLFSVCSVCSVVLFPDSELILRRRTNEQVYLRA